MNGGNGGPMMEEELRIADRARLETLPLRMAAAARMSRAGVLSKSRCLRTRTSSRC